MLTTLLAVCWGVSSAYLLFHALLITHDVRPCCAALVSLVVVWATLERKRWGRLALLGLSKTAIALFLIALFYLAIYGRGALKPVEQSLMVYAKIALQRFACDSYAVCALLILAAPTGLWLRRPAVIAEFETGKRAALATAQRAIALLLVSCWGLTLWLLFDPLATGARPRSAIPKGNPMSSIGRPMEVRPMKCSAPSNPPDWSP